MISVIMGAYREGEKIVRESIESILNQTYSDFEFIIVLDDPANQEMREVLDEYAKRDSRVRVLVNEKNMGLASSLNRALKAAKGYYIARMDADDVALEDRLKNQLEYLTANDLDLIGGVMNVIDEEGNLSYQISSVPTDKNKILRSLKYGAVIPHPTWFGKASLFRKLGGYRKMPYTEDYDFVLRAALEGSHLGNYPKPVLKYRMTKNSISRSNLYDQYLYMKYLSKAYQDGKSPSVSEAMRYAESCQDEKTAGKYSKANTLFNTMLNQMEEKQYGGFVGNGFRLLVASPQFLDKIRRFLMLSINSR